MKNLGNPLLSVPTPGALPLGGSHNVALEILQGNDESLDVGDFMGAERPVAEVLDVNSVMEKSRRI
jgi:proteasome maturation protein